MRRRTVSPERQGSPVSFSIPPYEPGTVRLLAVKEVHDEPGILRDDLTDRLRDTTGLTTPTVRRLLRELEEENHLLGTSGTRGESYSPA